ncbi:MAG: quinoprotein dehydrogenase-associated putative ABC transporter substrate-binding protein [Burkholderiales bacterium]
MNRYRKSFAASVAVGLISFSSAASAADEQTEEKILRVCQDPNNLPFSHKEQTGFENKIAELFAQDLGWKLETTWYPQRMGFIRNTLKGKEPNSGKFKCDLVTSVSPDFDLGLATKPYYSSTYTMVYVKGRGLDEVKTPEDLMKLDPEKRKKLRIGVTARTPVVDWLLKNNLVEQMVAIQLQSGDPEKYAGELIEKELAAGNIDAALVWGPIGGYFGKKSTVPMAVLPFKEDSAKESPLQFSIAMGVRYGEKPWRDRVNQFLEKNQAKITAIMSDYGVPLVDIPIVKAEAAPAEQKASQK